MRSPLSSVSPHWRSPKDCCSCSKSAFPSHLGRSRSSYHASGFGGDSSLMNLLSCPRINTLSWRHVSCLLSRWPSCMACLFASGIHIAGNPALSHSFQTLLPWPKSLPCLTLDLRSLWFLHWMTSWMAIGMSCYIAPSGLLRDIWPVQSSFVLISQGWLSLFWGGRNGCPRTPFHFGFGPSSTTPMLPLLRRIAGLFESRHTASGRGTA